MADSTNTFTTEASIGHLWHWKATSFLARMNWLASWPAIEVYLQEEPEQLKHRTDNPLQMIEQYVKARNVSTLPELDSSFYEADDDGALAMEYIRAHIDVFVAD